MSESPLLPPHYDLVGLDAVDSVMEEARRRAEAGAGEGTLVLATEQTAARTRRGHAWHSPPGNLHAALLLDPDFEEGQIGQLPYVTAVATGAAIAGLVTPMTGLRYAWPNKLVVNDLLAGRIELAAGPAGAPTRGASYEWVALGVFVNVAAHPEQPEPERFNSLHASGSPEVDIVPLVEDIARWFLSWVNRWADEGFEPIRRAWMLRADGIGDPIAIALGDRTVEGRLVEIDAAGAAVIEVAGGERVTVTLGEYFGL